MTSPIQGETAQVTTALSTKRQQLQRLLGQLSIDRATFWAHWRDLNDHILPRRGRFWVTDVNRGDKRSQHIIDGTPTLAARTLSSGMMSGITSPARPWFNLTVPDPELAEISAVKTWLYTVTERMRIVFERSNLYNQLPLVYDDLGVFGTAAMAVLEDPVNVIRTQAFPIGSYYLATRGDGTIGVFARDFRMTVRAIVDRFAHKKANGEVADWDNMSFQVQNLWKAGQADTWIDVVHVIQPNEQYTGIGWLSKDKAYSSIYFERGSPEDRFLLEEGFDEFPIMAPRWQTNAEDAYATMCPGMLALGDIRQLQLMEKKVLMAVEKMINPPMMGPSLLRQAKASILPGDITYYDQREGMKGFAPVYQVQFEIQSAETKQQEVRQRIQRAFYADLFLMLAEGEQQQMTAREVDERHEEKLIALGPVLESVNQDLLDPLVERTFAIMQRRGHIPPAPEALHGVPLRVEYVSIMAQAQKMIGLAGLERFGSFAVQLASVDPQVLDKIDIDQMIEQHGDMTGIPPMILVADDKVKAIRAQRAQQQQQQQAAENAPGVAGAAKTLSETNTQKPSALTALLNARAQTDNQTPQVPTPTVPAT